MCRRQPGIGKQIFQSRVFDLTFFSPAIGRLCEKCDGKWYVYYPLVFILLVLTSTNSVQYATHTFDQRLSSESAMNATLARTEDAVSSVVHQVSPTHTTVRNARGWRRTETVAPRSST